MAFTKKQVGQILDRLRDEYPEAGCALEHKNKYELIICVVLSAQTTDKSVNKISDALFEKYPTPYDLAQAEQEDVIDIIRTIGMYKTKSKNIIALAKALVADFDGQVPGDYDQLIKLPGVGRKTANVVLAVGFGQQRIAVDTHVFRVTNRIGLVKENGTGSYESVTGRPMDRSTSQLYLPRTKLLQCQKPEMRDVCYSGSLQEEIISKKKS